MDISPSMARSRRARSVVPRDEPSQIWTAARCLRLLRPIHVCLGNLRQFSSNLDLKGHDPKAPRAKRGYRGTRKHSLSDEEWSNATSKRSRVTYSQRKRKATKSGNDPSVAESDNGDAIPAPLKARRQAVRGPSTPGKLLISTPLIRKIRGSLISPHPLSELPDDQNTEAGPPGSSNSNQPALSFLQKDIRGFRTTADPTQVRHYEALLQALNSVLRHAAGRTGQPASRSLVAMCLRKAPHQLKRIEEWDAREAKEQGEKSTLNPLDAMSDMYQQMESLGHAGWRPLRHMVQAHAIASICNAISDGAIGLSFTKLLVKVCVHWQCFDEAIALLTSALELRYPSCPRPKDVANPSPKLAETLAFFITFCTQHDRWTALFYRLTRLLEENRISGEWLCIKALEPVWAGLTRRLVASGQICPGALPFFSAALQSLAACPSAVAAALATPGHLTKDARRAPEQMFISTVGAVTAMASMSGNAGDDRVVRLVLCALGGSLGRLSAERRQRTTLSRVLLELGLHIASRSAVSGDADGETESSALQIGSSSVARGAYANKRLYEGALSLICAVAQHCSRGSSMAPHYHLLSVCDSIAGSTIAGRSVTDVRKDGAFLLAQRTCDLRDLAFAESSLPTSGAAGESVADSESSDETSNRSGVSTLYTGWKWDEGISEWIIQTPAPGAVSRRVSRGHSREVVALRTRFGKMTGGDELVSSPACSLDGAEDSPARTRASTRTISGAVEAETGDITMTRPPKERATVLRGRQPLDSQPGLRNIRLRSSSQASATTDVQVKTRRKMVRKISSLVDLGSSDDELLL